MARTNGRAEQAEEHQKPPKASPIKSPPKAKKTKHEGAVRQSVFQSTIFRIVAVIIALVLPINIMTLVLSAIALEKNQEQVSREIQATLEVNAGSFEDMLVRSNRRLTYLIINEADFIALANATTRTQANERGAYLNTVKQDLKTLQWEYDWIDLFYFQFPRVDYVVSAGYPGISFLDCRETIVQASRREEAPAARHEAREVGGVSTLFSLQSWNNANFGVIVNLERLLDKLELADGVQGRYLYFADAQGRALTKAGQAFYEERRTDVQAVQKASRYQVFTVPIADSDLALVEIVDWEMQGEYLPSTIILLMAVSVLMALVVIPLLILYLRREVIRPLNRLVKAIGRIEQGDLDYRITSVREGREFDQINRSFNQMMDQVKALKIDVYDKELEKNNIRMRYLSQQVQPHFILNAMNIIYSCEPEEYPLIQKMVLCITKYFRYIVKVNTAFVTLGQELEHIENYFEIQRARFPGLFSACVECEDALTGAMVPPLLVQNFAENAIKHSLQMGREVDIRVLAQQYQHEGEARMRIFVRDTGPGITDEVLQKIERFKQTQQSQPGLGVGIENAIERLKHLYFDRSVIRFCRNPDGHGTTVEIDLPVHYEGDPKDENTAG